MPAKVVQGSSENQSVSHITTCKEARKKGVLRVTETEAKGNMPTSTTHIGFQASEVPSL